MALHPLFIDDAPVARLLDEASAAALASLATLFPDLPGADGALARIRADLARLLLDEDNDGAQALVHGPEAFGHRFEMRDLPLARASRGYAVQLLGTDTLLDRSSGEFLPVRDQRLHGLHDSFDAAYAAAREWIKARGTSVEEHALAIVPASYDDALERHILIYGVLPTAP